MARKIASNTIVDRTQLLDFVRPRHRAILATTRRNGTPQMSPNTMGVDDNGRLVISTYPHRAKVLNIRRNPRVSVCVLSDDYGDDQRNQLAIVPVAASATDAPRPNPVPAPVIMTFSGLKSRWTMPAAWAAASPRPASVKTARTAGMSPW